MKIEIKKKLNLILFFIKNKNKKHYILCVTNFNENV